MPCDAGLGVHVMRVDLVVVESPDLDTITMGCSVEEQLCALPLGDDGRSC